MTESPGYGQFKDLERQVQLLASKNERLASALHAAREQIVELKAQLDEAAKPPGSYAQFVAPGPHGTADVMTAGRKMNVAVAASVALDEVQAGQEVLLNESLTLVQAFGFEPVGEIVTVKELLGADRALVVGRADEERVVRLSGALIAEGIRVGDALTIDSRSGFVFESVPRSEVAE